MAVPIEFVSVIVRKSAAERRFPGGLDGFACQDLGNLTEDDHLLRVAFMSTAEALHFIDELDRWGLRYLGPVADSDIAVVGWDNRPDPPWLSVGYVDGHWACWASDYPPGEVVWPEPGFLLRCPAPVGNSLAEVARQCGAEIHEASTACEPGVLAKLRCVRGDAEILIDVFGDDGGSPVGLWGRRQLARRKQFRADVALTHDLVTVLTKAGAEGPKTRD